MLIQLDGFIIDILHNCLLFCKYRTESKERKVDEIKTIATEKERQISKSRSA